MQVWLGRISFSRQEFISSWRNYIHHIKKCLWESIRCLSITLRLRALPITVCVCFVSPWFFFFFWFWTIALRSLHACLVDLIWLGIYRTYWRDKVAVGTLLFRPGTCSGGRTQALTPSVVPGGRMHRQNTVHKYRTTSRAQATANPITEALVGQSSNKCSSPTASTSFQSSRVTRESVPRKEWIAHA